MSNNELFQEFPSVSKADWLQQIAKDLKGKSLEDYDWAIGHGLQVSPFVHSEDFKFLPSVLWTDARGWEICETIAVEEAVDANSQALEALIGGAEGLQLEYSTEPNRLTLEQTLAGVHLDFIGLHFAGKGISQNPAAVFGHLLGIAKTVGIDPRALHGSVAYDPVQAGNFIIDWRYLADLQEFTQGSFPLFKIITVNFSSLEDPALALAETLKTAHEYLKKLTERGVPAEQVTRTLQFSIPVGKSYFLEIAKIRALKLLWINILKGWNTPLSYPTVAAHFRPEVYTDDLYTNMIRATTMAMSAVLGGADRLSVLPYDSGRENLATYPPTFGRRIARNVQHLMKMESAMDDIADPAAGSYYIEQLTEKLAGKAWELFARTA